MWKSVSLVSDRHRRRLKQKQIKKYKVLYSKRVNKCTTTHIPKYYCASNEEDVIVHSEEECHMPPKAIANVSTSENCNSGSKIEIPRVESQLYSSPDVSDSSSDLENLANRNISPSDDFDSHCNVGVPHVDTELCHVSDDTNSLSGVRSPSDTFCNHLREWAIEGNISHRSVSALLVILKAEGLDVPKDARTLLRTPKFTVSREIGPGHYAHIGLELGLLRCIEKYYNDLIPAEILFNINIDGIPLSKSSGSQFWPILGCLVEPFFTEPFVIGIYHGYNKPHSANDFLKDFVEEAKVIQSGIRWKDVTVKVRLNAIICDAPARAFVACIKNHTGYFGCSKCIQEGEHIDNRVVFLETGCTLRTDESFKKKLQEEHHKGRSILEDLNVGMVSQFPIDYMHLVCLGIMKKLLQLWIRGNKNIRLSVDHLESANTLFLKLKNSIPNEFARKPRSLYDADRWKATEFRQFLLYTGLLVMRKFLSKDQYMHFLSLSCAMRILCSKNLCQNNTAYVDQLLLYFVKNYATLYGEKHVTYNVHNLLHITNDVKKFNDVDSYSSFKYENFLYKLVSKVKKCVKPLEQICNRLSEENHLSLHKKERTRHMLTLKQNTKELKYGDIIFTTKFPNNICKLNDGKVIIINNFIRKRGELIIKGEEYLTTNDFFDLPLRSQLIGIETHSFAHTQNIEININEIKEKCMLLPLNNEVLCLSLLHKDEKHDRK